MKRLTLLAMTMVFALGLLPHCSAQEESSKKPPPERAAGETDKALLDLSKEKWKWMSERKPKATRRDTNPPVRLFES